MALTVSKLATEAGVRPDTVRYYEKAGLLPPADRAASGYRLYGKEAVDRLRFIKGVQSFGLRRSEVRDLLEVMDRGLCPCGHAEGLVRSRIAGLVKRSPGSGTSGRGWSGWPRSSPRAPVRTRGRAGSPARRSSSGGEVRSVALDPICPPGPYCPECPPPEV